MSQDAYNKFTPEVKDGGLLLVEQDLVAVSDQVTRGIRAYSVPATRLAEQLGKRMVLNIVMVGFFAAVTGLITPEALKRAVEDSVPRGFKDLNLQAFEKGYEYGLSKAAEENGEPLREEVVQTIQGLV